MLVSTASRSLGCSFPPLEQRRTGPLEVCGPDPAGAQVCDRLCWFCFWVCVDGWRWSFLATLLFSSVPNRDQVGKFAAENPAKRCQLFTQKAEYSEYSEGKRSVLLLPLTNQWAGGSLL